MEESFDSKLRGAPPLSLEEYTDENGLITQCSNCRKVQRARETETWDWVPSLVSEMPDNVTHSICPICFDYHWTQGFAEAKSKVIPPPVTN